MEIEAITKVLNSEIFKKWHTDEYLVSYFLMADTESVDFFSKKNKKITSFNISDKIEMKTDDIFQKEPRDIEELKIDEVIIKLEQATKIINEVKSKKVPAEQINKEIIILQQQKVPIWNLTLITSALNFLNVKINAITGEIIEENLESLMKLRKNSKENYRKNP